jgi:hypothetical protein
LAEEGNARRLSAKPSQFQTQSQILLKIDFGLQDRLAALEDFELQTNREWAHVRKNAAIKILNDLKSRIEKVPTTSWNGIVNLVFSFAANPTAQPLQRFSARLENSKKLQSHFVSVCNSLISELSIMDIPPTEKPSEYVLRRLQEEGFR